MNAQRRKEIERALEMISEASSILEYCRDEEEAAFDNMPENLQDTERGQQMAEFISQLEDSISSLEDAREYAEYCLN